MLEPKLKSWEVSATSSACRRPRLRRDSGASSREATHANTRALVAEGVGFEPTGRYRPLVFKTSAFNRSATPPENE